jgi:hypothetical protein
MALFDIVRMGKRANASPSRVAHVSGSAPAAVEQAVVLRRWSRPIWPYLPAGSNTAPQFRVVDSVA